MGKKSERQEEELLMNLDEGKGRGRGKMRFRFLMWVDGRAALEMGGLG